MANILSKAGIITGGTVESYHVTQSIDAFTGTVAYDISLSGSLNVTGSINNLLIGTGGGNISTNISIGCTTNFSSSATGTNNFAAGNLALSKLTTGSNNIAIGNEALRCNTTGCHNTAIGCAALRNNLLGSNNIAFGQNAGCFLSGSSSNNIAIGFSAGPSTNTEESNKLYIASGSGTPLIKGNFACKGVSINSFLNLLESDPLPTTGEFSCNGTIAFSSSGNFFVRSASVWTKLNIN